MRGCDFREDKLAIEVVGKVKTVIADNLAVGDLRVKK